MNEIVVMTLIGPDRPGLVDQVSSVISRNDGNWLESRLAHLGGQFAGIIKISVEAPNAESLKQALRALDERGIHVHLASNPDDEVTPLPHPVSTLEIVGNDRKGIVNVIAQVLTRHHVNVEEFESMQESAPMSGDLLFRAKAKLSIPESCNIEALQEDLEAITADMMVDISLQ